MKVVFHRKEQWDLHERFNGAIRPLIACHIERWRPTHLSRRLFVLWRNGFRGFGIELTWRRYP